MCMWLTHQNQAASTAAWMLFWYWLGLRVYRTAQSWIYSVYELSWKLKTVKEKSLQKNLVFQCLIFKMWNFKQTHINKQYSPHYIHLSLTLSTFIVRPIDKTNMFGIKGLLVGFYGKWSVKSGQVSTVVRTLALWTLGIFTLWPVLTKHIHL